MAQDVAFEFAEYAASARLEDLPATAIAATKRDIMDSLSVGLAGTSAKGIREMIELAEEWGGAEQATVFGFGKKFPAHVAASINSAMIHGYDFDDTHEVAMMHCGCVVVSCALAAAEMLGGVSGADLLAAITVGLDIHCRLGVATTVGIVESGWVYTPLMGVFAGVAAAGRVMGLTTEQMVNAFGIAYSQAAGSYQAITDSAWTKRIQPGFASKAAITACEMAKKGILGIQNTFEGRFGFYHNYLNNRYDPAVLRDGLGKKFTHEELAFKPWPCGRPMQPPINVAIEAKKKFNFDPDQVKHVEIYTNEHLYVAGCIPEDIRKHPTTVVEGQFSIPYCAACGLVNGKVGLSDFTEEGIARPDVLKMAAKIDGKVDAEIEKEYHARVCPAYIKIEMMDGTVLEHYMQYTLGCEEKPMTEDDILTKMNDCIDFCVFPMPKNTVEKIRTLVNGLDTMKNTNTLIEALLPTE